MNDNELKTFVWELVNQCVRNLEIPSIYSFTTGRDIYENICFNLSISNAEDGIRGTVVSLTLSEIKKYINEFSPVMLNSNHNNVELSRYMLETLLYDYIETFLMNLFLQYKDYVIGTFFMPRFLAGEILSRKRMRDVFEKKEITTITNKYAELIKDMKKELVRELLEKKSLQHFHRASTEEFFAPFYSLLLPIWQNAKRIYEEKSNSKEWRGFDFKKIHDTIERELKFVMPFKLVMMLDETNCKEDWQSSEPSALALWNTAKLCNFGSSDKLKERRLYDIYEKSKETIAKDEYKNQVSLGKYLLSNVQLLNEELLKSGNQPTEEFQAYICEWIYKMIQKGFKENLFKISPAMQEIISVELTQEIKVEN